MIELDTTIEIVGGNKEITDAFISYNDFEEVTSISELIGDSTQVYEGAKANASGSLSVPHIMQIWGRFNSNASATIYFDIEGKNYPTRLYVLEKIRDDVSGEFVGGYASGEMGALYMKDEQPIMIGNTLCYHYIASQVFYEKNRFIETANFYDIRLSSGIDIKPYIRASSEQIDNTNNSVTFSFYVPEAYRNADIVCTYEVTWSNISRVIVNDSPIVPIRDVFVPQNELRIAFSTWSEPNARIKISRIDDGEYLYIGKDKSISTQAEFTDREDTKLPQYGVVSQGGRIEYSDVDGLTLYYIENGLASRGLKVITKLNNTLTQKSQIVSEKYTAEWDYDEYDKKVSISLTDGLEEWQDIVVPAINYDARHPQAQNAKWYYEYLHKHTPRKYKMLTFDELDTKTKNVLTDTVVPYPYLNSASLFQQWNKLCVLCQLHIYSQFDGKTICKYNEGN